MTDDTTQPDHELDRSVDPDPADEGPRDPDGPNRPMDSRGEASRAPKPEDADEGKDPGDISAAQIV
jgi:hypothetical protein